MACRDLSSSNLDSEQSIVASLVDWRYSPMLFSSVDLVNLLNHQMEFSSLEVKVIKGKIIDKAI